MLLPSSKGSFYQGLSEKKILWKHLHTERRKHKFIICREKENYYHPSEWWRRQEKNLNAVTLWVLALLLSLSTDSQAWLLNTTWFSGIVSIIVYIFSGPEVMRSELLFMQDQSTCNKICSKNKMCSALHPKHAARLSLGTEISGLQWWLIFHGSLVAIVQLLSHVQLFATP